jgi:serine/threonine-protein kinase PknG
MGSRLGAGLVNIAPIPVRDPASVVISNPQVAEERRDCSECGAPVGRGRDGEPGRTEGYCRRCGHPFSFTPKLRSGDLVAGQYEVAGCLAHGGLGWIYLARDRRVSDRWVVLKGLLNSGDQDAMAAALAERRFLAEVAHPNIVRIYNFVEHHRDGYIVMEYVDGASLKGLLEQRREENEGTPDPLPVSHAIAYVLEVLPALGYLHQLGLLYCDFKPDNVIQTASSVKLIDLGGVYRVDDEMSPVYGTVGYQAPEIADTGPTIPSDLFTVGRTLAVLCTNFRGYQSTYEYSLPAPDEVPLYSRFDSLYQLLKRATAPDPDARFQSAEEVAGQLLGVLREIVAVESGAPAPGSSTQFTGELRASDDNDWESLPALLVDARDDAAGFLAMLATTGPAELLGLLQEAPSRTFEVELRCTRTLIELGRFDEAQAVLVGIEADNSREWRVGWYRGLAALAAGDAGHAADCFAGVYATLPGELAPKLALAYAAESNRDAAGAARWYDRVSRTDPSFTSAAFGLARCLVTLGDHKGAVAAYDRVPATSRAYVHAQLAKSRVLIRADGADGEAGIAHLSQIVQAWAVAEPLELQGEQRATLTAEALEAALASVQEAGDPGAAAPRAFGHQLNERGIRLGLERTYRDLARRARTSTERIKLVDQANAIRPRTFV